jgi:hypothetical protein
MKRTFCKQSVPNKVETRKKFRALLRKQDELARRPHGGHGPEGGGFQHEWIPDHGEKSGIFAITFTLFRLGCSPPKLGHFSGQLVWKYTYTRQEDIALGICPLSVRVGDAEF